MSLDLSYATRVQRLEAQRTQLREEMGVYESVLHPEWMSKALNLLGPVQANDARNFFATLQNVIEKSPLGELAIMEPWFYALQPDQQVQVIELYNVLLYDDFGLVLTEYPKKNGLQSDLRFEIAYPVTSR